MIIADLHIHSKYSRGCSTQIDIDALEKYAGLKGVNLLGTGDFTHPRWIEELKSKLSQKDDTGIYLTKSGFPFICQTEISLIYSQGGRGRKAHVVVLAPNFDAVEQITEELKKKGRVDYDGRPIFGMSCIEFTEKMMNIDKDIEIIPAHIWTPWFSMFGANSGFDSVKECFGDQLKYIHSIETGMSSDPPMNWRLSQLDNMNIVSFSDMHSFWPWRMGREATLFGKENAKNNNAEELKEELDGLTYDKLIDSIRTGKNLLGTVEVDPGYGKYHFTGHRNCDVCLSPPESLKIKDMCPKCGRLLTVGVAERVEKLADRPLGYKPKDAKQFYTLIPLSDIIAGVEGKAVATKTVWAAYNQLIKNFGNEFNILLNAPKEDLMKCCSEKLADIIIKNRAGEIKVNPGYDGVYGVPEVDGIKIKSEDSGETEKAEKEKNEDKPGKAIKPWKKTQKSITDF